MTESYVTAFDHPNTTLNSTSYVDAFGSSVTVGDGLWYVRR